MQNKLGRIMLLVAVTNLQIKVLKYIDVALHLMSQALCFVCFILKGWFKDQNITILKFPFDSRIRVSKGEKEKLRLWILRSSLEIKVHSFYYWPNYAWRSKKSGVHINQFYKRKSQIIEWKDWLTKAFIGCQFLLYMFILQHFPSIRLLTPISMIYSSTPRNFGKVLVYLGSDMTLIAET